MKETSFMFFLGVLFVGLKLSGNIDWSWLWVMLPFWSPLLFFVVLAVFFCLAFICEIAKSVFR